MINGDLFDRPPKSLRHGETLALGKHRVQWLDAPHLPHAWECGYLFESATQTLLCGDLFTQGGAYHAPVTASDILEPSEAYRKQLDYFSQAKNVVQLMTPLAQTRPTTLACMHGSAWKGDGEKLLTELARRLSGD